MPCHASPNNTEFQINRNTVGPIYTALGYESSMLPNSASAKRLNTTKYLERKEIKPSIEGSTINNQTTTHNNHTYTNSTSGKPTTFT